MIICGFPGTGKSTMLDSCTLQMSTQEVPNLTMDFAVLPDDRGVLLARKEKECGE